MTHKVFISGIVALLFLLPLTTVAQQVGELTLDHEEAAKHFKFWGYSPYADRGFPAFPLWVESRWPIEWKNWPGAVAEDTVRAQVSYTPSS